MKNYLKIVFDLLKKEDLTQADILAALTFEERERLFYNSEQTYASYEFLKRCNEEGIYLFTDEEFKTLDAIGKTVVDRTPLVPKEVAKKQLLSANYDDLRVTNINFKIFDEDELIMFAKHFIDKINANGTTYSNNTISVLITVLPLIKSDEVKDQILNTVVKNKTVKKNCSILYHAADIAATFQDETYKNKWARRVKREYRSTIIKTFADEHKRVAHLLSLDKVSQQDVLLSLEDQELIKKLALIPSFSKRVLLRIKDEGEREKYFRRLATMIKAEDKGEIVASFSTREKQLELLKFLRTEKSRYELLTTSSVLTDIDKYRIARDFRSDDRKYTVATNLKNEGVKNSLYLRLENHKTIMAAVTALIRDINVFDKLISKLNERELKVIYEELSYNDTSYNLRVLDKIKDKKWVMQQMENIKLTICSPTDYTHLIDMYSKTYKLNRDHLTKFVQEFGYGTFKYINSPAISGAINLDEESFQKYLQLFKRSNFICDEKSVKNGIAAFAQQEYRYAHPNAINAFANLLTALDVNDDITVVDIIKRAINETNYPLEKISEFLGLDANAKLDKVQLSNALLNRLKEKDNTVTLDFVRELIGAAIDHHRNNKTTALGESHFANIPRVVSERSLMDYYVYGSDDSMLKLAFARCQSLLEKEEQEFMLDPDRLSAVLEFKRNPDNSKMNETLKKDLRLFGVIIRKIWLYDAKSGYMEYFVRAYPGIETKINYDGSHEFEYIFSILQQINPAKLKETVFNDPTKYGDLIKFLAGNKMLGATRFLGNAAEAGRISLDESLIATLINNYPEVCANVANRSDKRNGLAEHLIEAEYFNSESYRYENLFGKDVFRYLRNNPGCNSATSMTRKERIAVGTDYVKKIFERKYIPVPSQNEVYKLTSGKLLNAKLGDLTDLNNLVLGERTDACTRIGGAGREMFKLFTIDDRGFNIVFTDPVTGDFVSRASAFRNGNTIFINELKFSESRKYSTDDLIECIHKVAKNIVEQTKDEAVPIENVVISNRCAMAYSNEETVDLGVQNVKAGIGNFYTNIASNNAIVLATSALDKNFAPVKLQLGYKKYPPLRISPVYYEGHLALRQVNHMKTLKEFLGGQALQAIDIKKEGILACYSTHDWVIYVNDKKEIKTIVAVDKKEALEEMHAMLEELKGKLTSLEVNNVKSRKS